VVVIVVTFQHNLDDVICELPVFLVCYAYSYFHNLNLIVMLY
jgi:hypothetical protein